MANNDGAGTKARRRSLPKQATNDGIVAELLMLLETVTADGRISEEEVTSLQAWLQDNALSDLPGIEFLRTTVREILADGKVTPEERTALYKAVELILPAEARRKAKERRRAVQALEKEKARAEKIASATLERKARAHKRPVASVNFMVAGVSYEGRADVIARYASEGDTVFLQRDRENAYDINAIRVLLGSGHEIGFVPREYAADLAPTLDSGCRQHAYLTKILSGRRVSVPVVQAYLYRADANVMGTVSADEVPRRVTARQGSDRAESKVSRPVSRDKSPLKRASQASSVERSGCVGCFTWVLAVGGLVLFLILASG